MTKPKKKKRRKRKSCRSRRSGDKALSQIAASKFFAAAEGLKGLIPVPPPSKNIGLMWNLYIDWCHWKPVAFYVSFGEYMRLLLTDKHPGFSEKGKLELKEKSRVAREVFPILLHYYGITVAEELELYDKGRPLWKEELDSGKADPGEGFDGWLGQEVAKKDRLALPGMEKRLYDVVKAHLRGVRGGMLGTATRHIEEPKLPPFLAAVVGDRTKVPESDLVNLVQREADEVRKRPPTTEEKRHARRSIHNWGF